MTPVGMHSEKKCAFARSFQDVLIIPVSFLLAAGPGSQVVLCAVLNSLASSDSVDSAFAEKPWIRIRPV